MKVVAMLTAAAFLGAGASTSTPQSDESEPATCGNIVRAKLIILAASVAEVPGVLAALQAIKGVIRLSADDERGLVSLLVAQDHPMTPERAVEYLKLAGYEVVEATEEEYGQATEGLHTAPIAVPASVVTESVAGAPAGPTNVTVLDDSIGPLIDAFNAAKDKPRLIALLSPT